MEPRRLQTDEQGPGLEREGLPLSRREGASGFKMRARSTLGLRQLARKRRFSFLQVIITASQNDILLELVFSL